jgi:hypothetical protein
MPAIVPRLKSNIQDAATPNAQVRDVSDIAAFGGGQSAAQAASATQGVLKEAGDMVLTQRKQADDLAITQAYEKAVRAKNDLMWNPKDGAYTKKGQDAFAVTSTYKPMYDKTLDEIEGGLANDNQKAMFKGIRSKQSLDFDGDLQRHTFQEVQRFDDETTSSGLKTAQEDAVYNFQTPGKVGESIAQQKALIIAHAQRNGKSGEWVQEKVMDATSQTHTQVIDRMLANGDDRMATTYYNTVKSQVTGTDATKLEKALEEGSMRGESQRRSDQIISQYGSNMTNALAEARKIDDPKLRDATTERVKSEINLREAAKDDYVKKIYQQASNTIDKNGTVDAISPGVWSQFSVGEKSALKAYADHVREGTKPTTDMSTYYSLKDIAENPATRDKFKQMDLLKLQHKLSPSDLKSFIDIQTEAKNGKTDTLDGWRSDSEIVKGSMEAAGISVKDNKEKYDAFARQVDEQQQIMQQKLGRKLNNQEMQQVVDNLLVKGITSRGFFLDTKKSLYEVKPGEKFEVDAKDVPASERSKIEAALKANGKPVTDANVLFYYTKKLQGSR